MYCQQPVLQQHSPRCNHTLQVPVHAACKSCYRRSSTDYIGLQYWSFGKPAGTEMSTSDRSAPTGFAVHLFGGGLRRGVARVRLLYRQRYAYLVRHMALSGAGILHIIPFVGLGLSADVIDDAACSRKRQLQPPPRPV